MGKPLGSALGGGFTGVRGEEATVLGSGRVTAGEVGAVPAGRGVPFPQPWHLCACFCFTSASQGDGKGSMGILSPCPSAKLLHAGAVAKFLLFHIVPQHCHECDSAERVHH